MKYLFLAILILPLHFLQAQTGALTTSKDALPVVLKDSVFMLSGDTLIGKITIDKDNNQYLFKVNDTTEDILSPKKVKRFTVAVDAKNDEPLIYTIICDFIVCNFSIKYNTFIFTQF